MKLAGLIPFVYLAACASGHAIFQKVSVNGADQGQLRGVRAPNSNYPIENVNDPQFSCNKNIAHKDNNIITIPAGARVGAWWGHVIGGPQGPNDPDHPIAASHKGPIMVYLAKVDNAATATADSSLKWFKISEDGFNTSTRKWAVDTMIENGGWNYFDIPSCVAPGNYLMRVELLALHSAYSQGGAQFYMECAQINVTGSGTSTGKDLVSFPGAYSASHPGIQINIYSAGVPDNGGKPYQIPGPPVLTCDANSNPQPTTSNPPTPTPTNGGNNGGNNGGGAGLWAQCGGIGYSGPTSCSSGTCVKINDYYSQCQP